MRDYISDMLTRIRNGQRAGLDAVTLHINMPRICYDILNILYEEGYIRGFSEQINSKTAEKKIIVYLKYKYKGAPIIEGLFRVSTPGRRIYLSTKVLWKPKTSAGIFILSTPKGVLVDREARILNVGGEVLCGVF